MSLLDVELDDVDGSLSRSDCCLAGFDVVNRSCA